MSGIATAVVGGAVISGAMSSKAQKKLAENIRERRLQMELTQEGLAERSGVSLSTLRKFEQKGSISLESFLKLLPTGGGMACVGLRACFRVARHERWRGLQKPRIQHSPHVGYTMCYGLFLFKPFIHFGFGFS